MALPCTCQHLKALHDRNGCRVPSCGCALYDSGGGSVSGHPRIAQAISNAAQDAIAHQKYLDSIREVTVGGNTVSLPVSRHDPFIIETTKLAASRAIARVQTGTWTNDDLKKLAEIGAAKGCPDCEYVSRMNTRITSHLQPNHVAYIFGLIMNDELRENAYNQMVDILGSNVAVKLEQQDQLVGWRQFDLSRNRGGQVQKDGTFIEKAPYPRLWLSGSAYGVIWPGGDYQASCPHYKAYSYGFTQPNDPKNARELCLQHFDQSSGEINRHTLEIIRNECTCGAYAVTDRSRIMGHDSDTGSGTAVSNVKATVLGYGKAHVGADNASWRASDCIIDQLFFYPQLRIDGHEAPSTISGPWGNYAHVDFKKVADELSVWYNCPVHFCSETKHEKVLYVDGSSDLQWVDKIEYTSQEFAVTAGLLQPKGV